MAGEYGWYVFMISYCCHGYRPYHPVGELGTCQIYDVSGNLFVIIPQVRCIQYFCKINSMYL